MILEMMKTGNCTGVRVNEITEKTHLSRPAISHHLQILRDAGILKMRREATKNYYFDPDMKRFELLAGIVFIAVNMIYYTAQYEYCKGRKLWKKNCL